MFKTMTNYLRLLAAPATAMLLLGTLLILEERHFDQNSALLLALLTGIAVAASEDGAPRSIQRSVNENRVNR